MYYDWKSPSECAADVLEEIVKIAGTNETQREEIRRLVRQQVRLVIEQCAQVAEDYTANHDLGERMCGTEVGDSIAEALRRLADERQTRR